MSLIEDARLQLGELFIIGFQGLELADDTSAFLSQARIGGVILFSHNYENPSQVAELTSQIQECRSELPLWISVDHEGGKVQRFKKHFTKIPDAQALGALDSPKIIFEVAEIMAKELKAVGVNLNFCPVADILTNPKNPVIGNRAFGSSEDLVSKMVTAMVRGHIVQGVQACVKHFPGHGDTTVDSHLALPRVDTPLDVLLNREIKPFMKAFKSRCNFVMTAHILNPGIDPDFPATLSAKTIQELIKNTPRFAPLVVSDDLEMKAITDHFGAEDAPRMALIAGCDLLIYRSENAARHAYTALVKAVEDGKLKPEVVLAAAERVRAVKKNVLLPFTPASVTEAGQKIGIPEHLAVVQKIESAGRNKH